MGHLIVCADGTWSTPDQERDGVPAPTNVFRFHSCLADQALVEGESVAQRAYYHPGLGTEGDFIERTAGGVWGHGLSKNIQSAYHWLARNYQTDDAIYLLGYSRGAYTVRSLSGLLNLCGLLDLQAVNGAEGWQRVATTYEQGYRSGRPRADWMEDWAFHHDSTPIRFVGVWDTVGALGIPDDLALLNLFDQPQNWRFHDTRLGDNVAIARHALALDEVRASFTPTLWTKHSDETDVAQVWFPGVHGDVGGGLAEAGLSDGALQWMIEQAEAAGLAFAGAACGQIRPDFQAVLHDSYKGIFKTQRSRPRNVPAITDERIHASARRRHAAPPITQSPYRPTMGLAAGETASVDIFARERWNYTGVYLRPGKYKLRATGEWLSGSVASGPTGSRDGEFQLGEVAQLVGTGLGWLERGWTAVTGQQGADFKLTRRHEKWQWQALIGVVANSDRNPKSDGTPPDHQTFLIGKTKTLSVKRDGYLYCYANDAWDLYGNNRGSIQLAVECLELHE